MGPLTLPGRFLIAALSAGAFLPGAWPASLSARQPVRFAVIGDYGYSSPAESSVAALVRRLGPGFIVTTGDNNYETGDASTIDRNIGQYYHDFIFPYTGAYGPGDSVNRFFPALGNHDWIPPGALPYLDYFALPGNERYYEFSKGPVRFFAIDSDPNEPDGQTATSIQAAWLRSRLAASREPWNIVYFHHPPYTSGSRHGPSPWMRWPFGAWGVTAVLAGHEHLYERIEHDGIPYFVNGLGGRSLYGWSDVPDSGSLVRYSGNYGAMLVTATPGRITFSFVTIADSVVDQVTFHRTETGVEGTGTQPARGELRAFPNPFNPSTVFQFTAASAGLARLEVFDLSGRVVESLVSGVVSPGDQTLEWRPGSLASGTYLCRIVFEPSDGSPQRVTGTNKIVYLK